jgi:hypothetical protein
VEANCDQQSVVPGAGQAAGETEPEAGGHGEL